MVERRVQLHERFLDLLRTCGSLINTPEGWKWDPFNFERNSIDEEPDPDLAIYDQVWVYFQPPESLQIHYPCLIYELKDIKTTHADNVVYASCRAYKVTYITWNPDTEILDRILTLPMCSFDGSPYKHDNLYHYNFTIYY